VCTVRTDTSATPVRTQYNFSHVRPPLHFAKSIRL